MPSVVPVLNHYFLWVHRQPVLSVHPVHSLVLLSQEQVPSLLIQHLPNRLRFTLQQKIARAAQVLFDKDAYDGMLEAGKREQQDVEKPAKKQKMTVEEEED